MKLAIEAPPLHTLTIADPEHAIALLVFAHKSPAPTDIKHRAQGGAVPPGENPLEHGLL